MKILQVLPALGQGGVERGTVEIAQALSAAGIPNAVASAGGRLECALDEMGVEHLRLPLDRKNPFTLRSCAKRLAEYCADEGVTLMHVRSRAPAWAVKWASKRCGVKWIATFHGVYGTDPKFLKIPYNRVMLQGERTIAISEYVRRHILDTYRGVDPAKLVLIHGAVRVRGGSSGDNPPRAPHALEGPGGVPRGARHDAQPPLRRADTRLGPGADGILGPSPHDGGEAFG